MLQLDDRSASDTGLKPIEVSSLYLLLVSSGLQFNMYRLFNISAPVKFVSFSIKSVNFLACIPINENQKLNINKTK